MLVPFERSEQLLTIEQQLQNLTMRRRRRWLSLDDAEKYFKAKEVFSRWHKDVLKGYLAGGLRYRCGGSVPGLARHFELRCDPKVESMMYQGRCGRDCFNQLGRLISEEEGKRPQGGVKRVLLFCGSESTHLQGPWGDVEDYAKMIISALAPEDRQKRCVRKEIWEGCSHFLPQEEPLKAALAIKDLIVRVKQEGSVSYRSRL